jgi:hypothetical protein
MIVFLTFGCVLSTGVLFLSNPVAGVAVSSGFLFGLVFISALIFLVLQVVNAVFVVWFLGLSFCIISVLLFNGLLVLPILLLCIVVGV